MRCFFADLNFWQKFAIGGFLAHVVFFFFLVACTKPLGATHMGPAHCPEDIDANGYIDLIGDVTQFTAHFSESVPPGSEFDISPRDGDGFVDIIGDITAVTAHFSTTCTVSSLEEIISSEGESALSVSDCVHTAYTYTAYGPGNGWYAQTIQASTRCTVSPVTAHTGSCDFTMWWWDGSDWHMYGASYHGFFYVTDMGNFICGSSPSEDVYSATFMLPCGVQWQAKVYYQIYRDGSLVRDVSSGLWVPPEVAFGTFPC